MDSSFWVIVAVGFWFSGLLKRTPLKKKNLSGVYMDLNAANSLVLTIFGVLGRHVTYISGPGRDFSFRHLARLRKGMLNP